MEAIAARRLRVLGVPSGDGLTLREQLVVLADFAGLGFRVSGRELLATADRRWLATHAARMTELAALRGGDVEYVPLFLGFPDAVPDEDHYFAKRILGAVFSLGDYPGGTRLATGTVVPPWLFDLRDFGADPVTQMQTSKLVRWAKRALAGRKRAERVAWTDLELVPAASIDDRLRSWLRRTLAASSSVPQAQHADIAAVLAHFGPAVVDLDAVPQRENRALVLKLLWEAGELDAVVAAHPTPTELLRMFAALTDGDVSLVAPIRFPRFRRAHRRAVLRALAASPSLAEDLHRHRGLWLQIARYIHPGEYARSYPRVAAAFRRLAEGRVTTFRSRTEGLLAAGDLAAVLEHLSVRPTLLARRLHELLRAFPRRRTEVLASFAGVAASVPVKVLLVLRSYFATIDGLEHRAVVNRRGRISVVDNTSRGSLGEDVYAVLRAVDEALLRVLGTRPRWGDRVWIDPALAGRTVPLQARAASDGLQVIGRGTAMPLADAPVLRLFVYWKEAVRRTDLDLSVVQFDDAWGYRGHVSWTKLFSAGIVHSGDVQSAPEGAAEFIDITYSALAPTVRWLAVQIHRYVGDAFRDMTCHAGWMERDRPDKRHRTFDIASVVHKFDLQGDAGYAVPVLIDVRERRAVWVDLYVGGLQVRNTVEGSVGPLARMCAEVARFQQTRPRLDALVRLHARARGATLVDDPADADRTVGFAGGDVDVGDLSVVLSELL